MTFLVPHRTLRLPFFIQDVFQRTPRLSTGSFSSLIFPPQYKSNRTQMHKHSIPAFPLFLLFSSSPACFCCIIML